MKKKMVMFFLTAMCVSALAGCGEEKKPEAVQTETYTEENTVTVVSHDTEDIDFRIAVIPELSAGLERLMDDAARCEAANNYRFYTYTDIDKYKALFDCGTVDVATMTLTQAMEINEEGKIAISILAVNPETEDEPGVIVVTRDFAGKYPSALKVFMEEMKYSAKDTLCVTGDEMRQQIEEYLSSKGIVIPEEEFFDPFYTEQPAEDLKIGE
ncbi:MAG: hypothetical protein ACI4DV_08055 [Lachnospiraceae bacterium]